MDQRFIHFQNIYVFPRLFWNFVLVGKVNNEFTAHTHSIAKICLNTGYQFIWRANFREISIFAFFWHAVIPCLKVLTNEKRGGLKVVGFDRSPFKLFSLRFSTKSLQAPSCESPKTTQRTLSLSFEIKNCFPIAVLRRRFMKKSGKLNCHVVN